MGMFVRGDVEIYYEIYGDGFPVLAFAPGGLTSRIARWHGDPDRPDVPLAFPDPTQWLAKTHKVIVLDQRNAGRSLAPVRAEDGWHSFAADHMALLDHLAIETCHLLGACIGVSFALRLCCDVPERIVSSVLQNPIGRTASNASSVDAMFNSWQASLSARKDVDADELKVFRTAIFGGDFIFSVSREAVSKCIVPLLLLPGADDTHPAEISDEIADLAPSLKVLAPWKGEANHRRVVQEITAFLNSQNVERQQ